MKSRTRTRHHRALSSWLAARLVFGLWLLSAWIVRPAEINQDIYVWQRAWTPALRHSLEQHSANFRRLIVLGAEVTWKKETPEVARVPVDYTLLRELKAPAGLALRVGPYGGTFSRTNSAAVFLSRLAEQMLRRAREAGIEPVELQLDFDCATSRLAGYRLWVEELRMRIAPVPLYITALPTWMDNAAAFEQLVKAADGYVLQVHSFERPAGPDAPFHLCDPVAARKAVNAATKPGVPFRVALPTYGYVMGWDSKGSFLGVSAEGPLKAWPAGAQIREVRSDPKIIADLVHDWSTRANPLLTGIVWYRFPVPTDTLNWKWPTLNATMHGRLPRESVRAQSHRVEPGLVQITLENDGELDFSSTVAIQARWLDTRLLAADALRGFELKDRSLSSVRFETGPHPYRLAPGEKHVVGWLRLEKDREVQVELKYMQVPKQ